MFLEKIVIEKYGPFSCVSFEPDPGVNVFVAKDEATRAALFGFLTFMLYGESEDPLLAPAAAGSLTVKTEEGRYQIERRCKISPEGRRFSLVFTDLATGEPLTGVPGETLLGIDRAAFCGIAGIGRFQKAKEKTPADNPPDGGLPDAMVSLLFSGSETIDPFAAMAGLEHAAEHYRDAAGHGSLDRLDKKVSRLAGAIEEREQAYARQINRRQTLAKSKALFIKNGDDLAHYNEMFARIEAMAHLRGFLILERKEAALVKAAEALAKEKARDSYREFLPDASYLTALDDTYADLVKTGEALAAKTEEEALLPRLTLSNAETSILKHVDEKGGKDGAVKELQSAAVKESKRKRGGIALIISAILFCLASLPAFLGLFTSLSSQAVFLGTLFLCAGLVLAVGAAILLAVGGKRKKEVLLFYRAGSLSDALAAMENACAARARWEDNQRQHEKLRHEVDDLRQQLAANEQRADALLSRWGRVYQDLDSVVTTRKEVAALLTRLSDANAAFDAAMQAKDKAAAPLAGVSRQEVEETITRTAPLGDLPLVPDNDLILKRSFCDKRQKALGEQIAAMEEELNAQSDEAPDLSEEKAALAVLQQSQKAREEEYKSLLLSREALEAATERYRKDTLPALAAAVDALLLPVFPAHQQGLGLAGTLALPLQEAADMIRAAFEKSRPAMRTLIYTALRLAHRQLKFAKEAPPLFFDSLTASLPPKRQEQIALLFGASGSGQVFLLEQEPWTLPPDGALPSPRLFSLESENDF